MPPLGATPRRTIFPVILHYSPLLPRTIPHYPLLLSRVSSRIVLRLSSVILDCTIRKRALRLISAEMTLTFFMLLYHRCTFGSRNRLLHFFSGKLASQEFATAYLDLYLE